MIHVNQRSSVTALLLVMMAAVAAFSTKAHATTIATAATAVPTEIVVRAKARDGKFIGSSVGGAMVRIKDADTGIVLAEGLTSGSTGNTQLIMNTAQGRYDSIAQGAAAFTVQLPLVKPTFVTIELISPYIKRQAKTVSQVQTWIVPGKPISGDGIIIEVPGMIVDVLQPQTHRYTSIGNSPFEITANVVMMCGCILTKGGLWDADKMEVTALVEKNGQPFQTVTLAPQDQMNTFTSAFEPDSPGNYTLTVYAYDPKTGNTGVDQTSFVVTN